MINFILYEDDKNIRNKYKNIINNLFYYNYKIYEIDKYDIQTKEILNNIKGHKIYILDVEVPGKSGLDLARKIRNDNDWQSQIIIITFHDKAVSWQYNTKLLMIDIIYKFDDCFNRLREAILQAYKILTTNDNFKVLSDNVLYLINYDEILFIEKELGKNYCNIYTINKIYKYNKNITEVEKELNIIRFLKVNRSTIINIFNIDNIDFNTNLIRIKNSNREIIFTIKKDILNKYILDNL